VSKSDFLQDRTCLRQLFLTVKIDGCNYKIAFLIRYFKEISGISSKSNENQNISTKSLVN